MWRLLFLLLPTTALAESVVAARVIKAQTAIMAADLMLVAADIPGALTDPTLAIGQQSRAAIYPGRPVLERSIVPVTLVDRNQIVVLTYMAGGLAIRTEGRALNEGSLGDIIEVMNLTSRTKITGRIDATGGIIVGPQPLP